MSGACYAVEVRDHVMLAHSLRGAVFGPAQGLHGATYVVRAAFFAEGLTGDGIVLDIGRARAVLAAALDPLRYANLDALPEFAGVNTTTEVLCRWVFDRLAAALAAGALGPGSARVMRLRVTLEETPDARAWYEAPPEAGAGSAPGRGP